MAEEARLRIYRFDPGAAFDGAILSAIERMQLTGDGELLDALLVMRDPASGELQAIDLGTGSGENRFVPLLDFRLDPGQRRALTDRTMAAHPGGVPAPLIEAIAATLEAGSALFAVLWRGETPAVLDDAATRTGARLVADDSVDARRLSDAAEPLRLAAIG